MPKIFRDAQKDEWELALTFGTVEAIEITLGINLGCPEIPSDGGIPLLARLAVDFVLQSKLIWLSCKHSPIVARESIKEVHFYDDILVGETFRDALAAWLQEYRDFFHRRLFGDLNRLTRLEAAIDEVLNRLSFGKSSGSGPQLPA
jgi:hypothetical protein